MAASILRHARLSLAITIAAGMLFAALVGASPASAATWWNLGSSSTPTNLAPGGKGQLTATATNLGPEDAKASEGKQIKLTEVVPAGLTVVPGSVRGFGVTPFSTQTRNPQFGLKCTQEGNVVSCLEPTGVPPYAGIEVVATVTVAPEASGVLNDEVKIEGGEGPPTAAQPFSIPISAAATPFGVERYKLTPENTDGSIDSRAGSHPYQLTTTFDLNQSIEFNSHSKREEPAVPAQVRDLHFVLPPGLLGNITVLPRCSSLDFATITLGGTNLCPQNTALGVARVTVSEPNNFDGLITETIPVFNLTPSPGEPARFGFELDKVPITLNTAVRTGKDYAVEVTVSSASQAVGVLQTQLSFWGVPGEASHDAARGWECVNDGRYFGAVKKSCPVPTVKEKEEETASAPPFLTMPTVCGEAKTTVTGDAWPLGGQVFTLAGEYSLPGGFTDCDLLGFTPSFSVEPEEHSASTPTGLAVKVHLPQESTLAKTGLAEETLKETVVTLPEGVQASPGAANGLIDCSASSFGFEGLVESDQLDNEHFTPEADGCLKEAKIGTMSIKTPLLEHELQGSVYLAHQGYTLLEQRLVLYLTAFDPVSGVRVKLAGDVHVDPNTGRLTSTFKNSPPVPFEDLSLNFFNGPRASQSTPPLCGTYATAALFVPWSGAAPTAGSSPFSITSGAGGGPCETGFPQPFGPSFNAGSVSNLAGGFTNFSLTIGHPDSDQPLSGLTMKLPPGAAAMLSSVERCKEPPAGQEWSCGADSLIGHSTASSGFGATPFTLGGNVYLTEGYGGAPFGLLVSTDATHAGPFNLGFVNVRSRIFVDRSTAAVTIVSDPFPTFVRGVPVQLKQINVTVDRPNFEFNPTNCSPMPITGTLTGAQGGSVPVSSPFQVTNCPALPFKPTLTASTQGNASKANGASLTVKVTSMPGQANIAKTKLVLPITLPSRLTTIQKACLAATFEANPAACNEGSNIGSATVHTPVLTKPLTGPAYLVSHGNAAFPDVEFVLQGEGITLILDGQTDIKKGITTSTFNAVPDAPVTTFETTLPEGPHSALTSNVAESKHFSLCGAQMVMPTTITGQNGAVIQQQTKIPVTGCPRVKGFVESKSQKLAKALKACRKQFKHNKKKRAGCEAKARKKYSAKKASKKAKKKKK
jgi:uncharacterized repeat protein (TIGR01451 family)